MGIGFFTQGKIHPSELGRRWTFSGLQVNSYVPIIQQVSASKMVEEMGRGAKGRKEGGTHARGKKGRVGGRARRIIAICCWAPGTMLFAIVCLPLSITPNAPANHEAVVFPLPR